MTTTSGTYMFCDADSSFSMTMNCAGPNCSKFVGNSNLTCTQTGSDSWQCSNGVNCDSASGFTSIFSIVETNTTVLQTQNVSINGTTFTFQQDGAGDVTLSNTTSTISSSESSKATTSSISSTSLPSTTSPVTGSIITSDFSTTETGAVTTTLSPSTGRTSSASTRQSYSTVLLITMLALSLFLTQAQAWSISTGNDISASVGYVLNLFNTGTKAGTLFEIAGNAIAGEFNQVVISTCGALVSEGVGNLVGLPLAYGQCEEAMVGAEMAAIGSSLGLTLRTYAGLGGFLTTALTAADEAAVLAADASAIPEVFIINSVLCGLLIAVIEEAALGPASNNLCSALANAASNYKPNSASTSTSTSTTSKSTSTASTSTTTTSSSTTPSTPSSSPTPSPPSSLSIPSVAPGSCASCQLSVYALGVQGLAAACNVATPLGTASDLSVLLCDSSYNGLYNQFCATFCANPCATYSIDSWIQSAGSQFVSSDTLATCNNLCPGFEGDGRCSSPIDSCSCAVGSDTCVPC